MRKSAIIERPRGLGPHDHAGWAFDHPDRLRAAIADFMADGLSLNQRVVYVGNDDAGLTSLKGFDDALTRDQARLARMDSMYPSGTVVDPDGQVAAYRAATEEALADGYTGLRVAADSTSLVVTEEQRRAWVRYEYLIDRFIARNPMTGLCCFNQTVLGSRSVAEIECVHPLVNRPESGFRIYASTDPGLSGVLTGEIDPSNRELFAHTLHHASLLVIDGAVVLDARQVTYMDHRALAELGAYAAQRDAKVVLYAGEESAVSTLSRVLMVPGVRVVNP
jgi:anti-anti-sigma regulatory factor